VLIEPYALQLERDVLSTKITGEPYSLLLIDELCPVITPYHWFLNRLREKARGSTPHGSCGRGVGELKRHIMVGNPIIYAVNLLKPTYVVGKLKLIQDIILSEAEAIDAGSFYCSLIKAESPQEIANFYYNVATQVKFSTETKLHSIIQLTPTVFEGSHGILLDEEYGFAPYNTWSNTTTANAERIIRDANVKCTTVGVLRTYYTRHGPGPFISECFLKNARDDYNTTGEFQGPMRFGAFDTVALQYALDIQPVQKIALNHLDQVIIHPCVESYSIKGGETQVDTLPIPCTAEYLKDAFPYGFHETSALECIRRFGLETISLSYGPEYLDRA
jgi:adenylosuccinate synthase